MDDDRKLGGGAIASLSGLGVLLIFVFQNTQDVRFHFLFLDFTWPLWLYTIVVALFGAAAVVRTRRDASPPPTEGAAGGATRLIGTGHHPQCEVSGDLRLRPTVIPTES